MSEKGLAGLLTNSFVSAVQKLSERRGSSLGLNHACTLLVCSQLAQHPSCHALDVLNLVVEQLHKDGDDGEAADDGPVVGLPGQDVERSHGAFDYLLHPHTISIAACRLSAASPAPALRVLQKIENNSSVFQENLFSKREMAVKTKTIPGKHE